MTHEEIHARVITLRSVLDTTVVVDTFTRYPDDHHSPEHRGRWYVSLELPNVESLAYEQMQKIAEHLGTTRINFQSATENGYYGEYDNIVRLWACWMENT